MDNDRSKQLYTLLVTTMSSFLTPFISSSVNLALPSIGQDLHADALSLGWIRAAYLLTSAALLVPFGRSADLYGRRRFYLAGLAVFATTSVLSAGTRSVQMLIALRALEGLGGAMIFGTAMAILIAAFPPAQRGRVLGVNVAATYTGLSVGPLLGGLLTKYLGWRSIFAFTAGLSLIVLPLALLKLRGEIPARGNPRFDWPGAALYSLSVIALLYGISSATEAAHARWLLLAGALGLAAFIWVEMRSRNPVLDIRRFRSNIVFIFSNLAALIHYSATATIAFFLSLYLQVARAMGADRAGMILLAQPVVMAALSPLAGWLSDRLEPRLLASLGMGLTAGGLYSLSTFGADTPLVLILGVLLLIGLGYALFSSPNTNAVMSSVGRPDYGVASSTLGTMRLIGQALSMASALLLFAIYIGRVQVDAQVAPQLLTSMRVAFRLFSGLCVLGILSSLARGKVRT